MKLSALFIPFVAGILVATLCAPSSNAKSLAVPNALAAADATAEPAWWGWFAKVLYRLGSLIFKKSGKKAVEQGVKQAAKQTSKDTMKQAAKSGAKTSKYAKSGEALQEISVEALTQARDEIVQ